MSLASVCFQPDTFIATDSSHPTQFYAGWLILQTSLTSFLELMMIGLPWIFYIGIRAAKVPRQRNIVSRSPNASRLFLG